MRCRSRLAWVLVPLLASLLATPAPGGAEPPARVPGTIRLEGDPDGLGTAEIVEAFPGLTFERPVFVGHAGDGTNRLFVAEQGGVIRSFDPREPAKSRVVLDLSAKVLRSHAEEGLLGVAFHPGFRRNGLLYVAYSADAPRRTVVSRFTAPGSRLFVRPQSEQVIFQERQPAGGNNGGWMAFGPDEFLYLSLGDGGQEGDPEGLAQNLSSRLGKLLRLDVGERKTYSVPQDNPFVEIAGARPEIWALGFRHVKRFAFDPVRGDLWAGDTGLDRAEEIDLVTRGQNYGWNLREGLQPYKGGSSLIAPTDPILEIPRAEARSITGGVVYRGRRVPALEGAYLYGDQETGNVWGLRHDGRLVKENRLLARGKGVLAFGTDEAGEVYLACLDGRLYTLAPGREGAATTPFPARLSATGLFTDLAALTPHPALVPYDVNVPLWSDGAAKRRWIMLPDLARVKVDAEGGFTFPVGTLFVKDFHLGDPAQGGRRLETRVLLLGANGWAGYTYVWNDEQTDAFLIDGRVTRPVAGGGEQEGEHRDWTFPGRSDCMSCHTAAAGFVLGFRREQLARPGADDPLKALVARGLFEGTVEAALAPRTPPFPVWDAPDAPLVAAVRAYLDVNCAMCHQPGGPGNANIDLRATTPLDRTNLVDRRPGQHDLGLVGARLVTAGDPARSLLHVRMGRTDEKGMPPIAHHTPDPTALERVAAWIRALK